MIKLVRTDSRNPDFILLVSMLDNDLSGRDGEEHSFYAQYNKIDNINYVIIAYVNGMPVACGAVKHFEPGTMEVKRMFVIPENRGIGIASQVLHELEVWSKELLYIKCILETGKRQPEAIRLYQKNGYTCIPNYGQYTGKDNSMCFEKSLI